MVNRKTPGSDLTPAQRRAREAFKPRAATLTEDEQSRKELNENRERLKALRLAREAEQAKKA